jgi:hypothetical protein
MADGDDWVRRLRSAPGVLTPFSRRVRSNVKRLS